MKAEELRVGNRVTDHTGVNNIVKTISAGWVKFIDDEACAFDLAKGIYITSELLAKIFPIVRADKNVNFFYNIKYGVYAENREFYFYKINDFGIDTLRSIKYVHQLQNIYYCLMGKELKIEL